MTNFTFQAEQDNGTTITYETAEETWYMLAEQFTHFLRGCGFVMPDGSLDFIEEGVEV